MTRLEVYIENEIKTHGKYVNGADGWLIREKHFKLLTDGLTKLFQTNIVPLPKGTRCECGRTADGTLYDKPMCEACLHYNT